MLLAGEEAEKGLVMLVTYFSSLNPRQASGPPSFFPLVLVA